MPHFHIEYSANLEPLVDIGALCAQIREQAAALETFPMPGVRVRATRVDHYSMADGNPKHGFIDLSIRLRAGRSEAQKEAALEHIFSTLKTALAPLMAHQSVALSAEIRDIDDRLSRKYGTVRAHLEDL